MFFPARPSPAGAPVLDDDDDDVIKWAREQVGVQGDDPIPNDYFRDDERATSEMILKWIVFYAHVLQKIEGWSRADKRVYGCRLALPLSTSGRKHIPVDVTILYILAKLTKEKFEETLGEVNAIRRAHGHDPITWDSLGAPPLPAKNKFVARAKAGEKSCAEQWLRFLFKVDKLFGSPGSNKNFPFTGVFFYFNAVQICFLYEKIEANEPQVLTEFNDLRVADDEADDEADDVDDDADDYVTDVPADEFFRELHDRDTCEDDGGSDDDDDDDDDSDVHSSTWDSVTRSYDAGLSVHSDDSCCDEDDEDEWSRELETVSFSCAFVVLDYSLHPCL